MVVVREKERKYVFVRLSDGIYGNLRHFWLPFWDAICMPNHMPKKDSGNNRGPP
jgi:hypothetical protein